VAKSHNTGLELNYTQPLSFLPGALSGLSFFFNETHIIYDIWDNYLTSSKDIANVGLSYQYKKYSARFAVNRTGYHQDTTAPAQSTNADGSLRFDAAGNPVFPINAGIVNYTRQRTMCDISIGYEIVRNISVFANGRNIFNEPLTAYSLSSAVITRQAKYGALWTVGVSGKF
jgi:iron complex outermembrane receptor protein